MKKINNGNAAAVIRLKPNTGRYSTNNGHYIVAVDAKTENGTNKVLIWDPGSKKASRDNAWVDVNEIVKYTQPDYSFIEISR